MGAKFEMGLKCNRAGKGRFPAFSGRDFIRLLNGFMEIPVTVPDWGASEHHRTYSIGQAGLPLAKHTLWVTTEKPFSLILNQSWVHPGRPLLLVEYSPLEAQIPENAILIDLGEDIGFSLAHCRLSYHGMPTRIWFIERQRSVDKDALRRLRLHLCRLHAEYEWIRLIARSFTGLKDKRDAQPLLDFLEGGIDFLSSPRKYGFDQDPILATAYTAESLTNEAERDTLLGILSKKRASEFQRFEAVAKADLPGPTYSVQGEHVVFVNGGLTMSDYRFKVEGDFEGVVGDKNVVKDSFQVIDQSSAGPEVKDLLKQLTEAVALAASRMPKDQADRALSDLDNFCGEALTAEPRKTILQAFGDALTKTASLVGDIGVPVAKLAAAVIALF
ncbi:hypothetical protein [Streptomyces sp. XY332]|uniref:hypothetical protein n=1 Tax=Streptomyces sp. XY332 TaxID=1415561 RepID=UPI00131CE3A3|nr:hypothetical protein [Streptomyces sp. XY332]